MVARKPAARLISTCPVPAGPGVGAAALLPAAAFGRAGGDRAH